MITDKQGNTWYKVGLHIHTTLSDGRKTPEEVIARYRANGYDAIALTDHWKYGAGGTCDGMLILSGCEYNSRGHDAISGVTHIVGIGMQSQPQLTRESTRQQIMEEIDRCGGIAVLAHPAWSMNTVADAQELTGITHTEVYNAVSESHQSMRAYSEGFVDLCANAGIHYQLLATDDAHYYEGDDDGKGWVMVRSAALSGEAIMEALRAGNFYASQGPELRVTREGNRFTVECSPCVYVAALSNLAWTAGRISRGENITRFTYECKETETWLRIQCCDEQGRLAWSNVYQVSL